MNLVKYLAVISFMMMNVPTLQAEDVAVLPSIHAMAESELREEAGIVPFQEIKQYVRRLDIILIKFKMIYRIPKLIRTLISQLIINLQLHLI